MITILVATDAWHPQINGVVRSLEAVAREAKAFGAKLSFLTPQGFRSVPAPTYPDIRLSFCTPSMVRRRIEAIQPDYIHIATEGPIGWAVRAYCLRAGRAFTTSYHTRFPEYLSARFPIPERWSYAALRRFHNAGCGMMVTTPSLQRELEALGFEKILRWSRGVDTQLFRPREKSVLVDARPIFLYVGRVAVEKNIEAFLSLDLPGSKVIVGDGPQLASLSAKFPGIHFMGVRQGEALAEIYASADVFVFSSRTDTFGIVLLEALASGLPVAAYPVTGPADVVGGTDVGVLDDDLRAAALGALSISKEKCRDFALRHTWAASAEQFITNIVDAHQRDAVRAKATIPA